MQSRYGHRGILSSACILEAIVLLNCILVLGYTNGAALVPLACLSLGCANLFYSVTLLFMTESYPTTVRAVMSALSVSLGRCGAIGGPSMVELMGFTHFLVFTGAMACLAVPVVASLAETKGKQLEDYLDEGDRPEEAVPLMVDAAASVPESDTMSEADSDRHR